MKNEIFRESNGILRELGSIPYPWRQKRLWRVGGDTV